MSKVLRPGLHDYGNLSIFVEDNGFCCRGLYSDGYDNDPVRPYVHSPYGGLEAVSFKAYSGHHTRYIWM